MKKGIFSKGFTVVELIISVLVMAILAELTIPYFLNQRMRARAISVDAMSNAVSYSVLLAIKKYHIQHISASDSIVLNGKSVRVKVGTGYPTGDAQGIGTIVGEIPGFVSHYGEPSTSFELTPEVNNCHVTYFPNSGQALPTVTGC